MARKEGCRNTWLNHFYPYIRDYGDGTNVLTSDQCWSIPNDVKCARSARGWQHTSRFPAQPQARLKEAPQMALMLACSTRTYMHSRKWVYCRVCAGA